MGCCVIRPTLLGLSPSRSLSGFAGVGSQRQSEIAGVGSRRKFRIAGVGSWRKSFSLYVARWNGPHLSLAVCGLGIPFWGPD